MFADTARTVVNRFNSKQAIYDPIKALHCKFIELSPVSSYFLKYSASTATFLRIIWCVYFILESIDEVCVVLFFPLIENFCDRNDSHALPLW